MGSSTGSRKIHAGPMASPKAIGVSRDGTRGSALMSATSSTSTPCWLNTLASGGVKALFAHIYPLVYSDRTIENGGSPAYLALRERFLALNSYEQVHQNLSASLTSDDDPKKLERIVCPTLLLAGEADFLTCPSSLAAACRLLPAGGMQILDFSGHIPYFEATAAFEAAVQSFIDAAERR